MPPCPGPRPADLGSYQEAAHAYERAGDVAAAVRVLLDRLDDAEAAAALADTHGGAEPRLAVARHFERAGRLEEAMRLYCLAGACPAAFLVAQRNACVPAFAELVRAGGWAEAAELAATHYELAGQLAEAGDMAALAGQTERAARLLLQASVASAGLLVAARVRLLHGSTAARERSGRCLLSLVRVCLCIRVRVCCSKTDGRPLGSCCAAVLTHSAPYLSCRLAGIPSPPP